MNGISLHTLGDLRRAFAGLPDTTPVSGGFDGLTERLPDELTGGQLFAYPIGPEGVELRVEIVTVADDDEHTCRECGEPCFVDANSGTSHHYTDGTADRIDHDADADHVAIPESEGG